MARDFEIHVETWEGLDVSKIVSEELWAAARRTKAAWVDNLAAGVGAKGSHGRPYEYTGESQGDVTVEPPSTGAMAYLIGGNVKQLIVAEFGRRPGVPPPAEAIWEWARIKGLQPAEGQTFEQMVYTIRNAIKSRGLPAFAPGQKAFDDVTADLEERIKKRLEREYEAAARRGRR